jgi:hypothetical protein
MKNLFSKIRRPVGVVMAATGIFLTVPAALQAGVIFYTNQATFYAAEPGLPVQSFTNANLYSQTFVTQPNGINSTTSNAVFAAGSILAGLAISTLAPTYQDQALIVDRDGPVGTISIGVNTFGDTLVLSFSPGVQAVGENLFGNTGYGTSFAGSNTVRIFSGTTRLGSITVTNAVGDYSYVGVVSTNQPITSLEFNWDGDGDGITFVSDIAFGTSAPSLSLVASRLGNLEIVWPATGSFTLLQSTNLTNGSWVTNTSSVTTSNGTNRITITPSDRRIMFFRLRYP